MSLESVLFRQHSHFYSLAKLLMHVKCGRLQWPCVFGYGFQQGCSAGMCGRARVCTGGFLFFLVLCWLHGWLYLVCCWGFLRVWSLLRVRCRAWCRRAVSTRCAAVAHRGLLSETVPWVWAVRGVAGVVLPAAVCCVSCFATVCCC